MKQAVWPQHTVFGKTWWWSSVVVSVHQFSQSSQARSYVQARGGNCLLVTRRLHFFETQINVMRNCVIGELRVKIVATRCQILWLKCTKFDFGWGSRPRWGSLQRSPDPLVGQVVEPSAWLLVWAVHAGRTSRWTTASPFSQPQLARRPKVPAEHVWSSCLCRGCASNLEFTVRWTAKPRSPQCHLSTQLEDVSVWQYLVHWAH